MPSPRRPLQGQSRPGYTLLEVTLALAVAVLLLAALYAAFFTLVRQTFSGRLVAERASVRRAVFRRFTEDVSNHLAPFDPRQSTASATPATGSADSQNSNTQSQNSGTQNQNSNTQNSGNGMQDSGQENAEGSGSTAGQNGEPAAGGVGGSTVLFNLGVIGDSTHLDLFVTGVPGAGQRNFNDLGGPVSDLKRISYWLADGGLGVLGLARKEYSVATAEDAINEVPWQGGEQEPYVFAREVRTLEFAYFDVDLREWVGEWDGSAVGVDGQTPVGPPAAIRITIGIADPGAPPDAPTRRYQHVVLIPTANGFVDPTQVPLPDMGF